MEEEYLPVSLIAEIAYCPRNFYLRYIEKLSNRNYHMLIGKFMEDKRQLRSQLKYKNILRGVVLASEKLNLICKIDEIKLKNGYLIPVEFKQKPHNKSLNPLPEDIQLALEGMILEENTGQTIPFGYIWYSKLKSGRKVIFTKELKAKAMAFVEKAKEIVEGKFVPKPKTDGRCHGCSFYEYCHPIETYKIGQKDTIYIHSQGSYVRKRKGRIIINKHNAELGSIPINQIDSIVAAGNVNFSAAALKTLLKKGITVYFMSTWGKLYGFLSPFWSKCSLLRRKQYQISLSEELCLKFAKSFVKGKIKNMGMVLKKHNQLNEEVKLSLQASLKKIKRCQNLKDLLGTEGFATQVYFSHFARMIRKKEFKFVFEKREKRPPKDPVNALLSFGYSLLFKNVNDAVLAAGLDPYAGFYHKPRAGRPSLTLDLMEEFRPIVDSFVISFINKNSVSLKSFHNLFEGWFLKKAVREKFIKAWNKRLSYLHRVEKRTKRIPLQRIFYCQAVHLSDSIRRMSTYKPFLLS